MSRKNNKNQLVWSSDSGRQNPDKDPEPNATPGDGVVLVSRQTKGRKGKGVTVISGIPLASDELKDLARTLKMHCGSGGTVKRGTIEIQGDHRDVVVLELKNKGWVVKKSGG